jgi:hypothetical protein
MKTLRTRAWLWAAFLSLAAMPVWADGELDGSFGANGVVKIAFPNSSRGYLRDIAVVDGFLEAAGYERESEVGGSFLVGCSTPFPDLFIVKVSLSGEVIGSPSGHAQQTIRCPSSLLVDSGTGDIYLTGYVSPDGSLEPVVAQFDSTGNLIASYLTGATCEATRILLDSQGRLVAPCVFVAEFGLQSIAALLLSAQGGLLTGGFLPQAHLPSAYRMSATAIAQDGSSSAYYVGGAGECMLAHTCGVSAPYAPAQFVVRLSADSGSLDTSYGSGGVAAVFSLPRGELNGITLDGSGSVVIAGDTSGTDAGLVSAGYVARFDPSGTPDPGFGAQGVVQITGDSIADVRTDQSDRVYALGATSELRRFKVNGAADFAFAASSNVQTLNGAGSSWQSLQFADSTRSSLYLLGGVAGCASCANAATTAVIAKVNLDSGPAGRGSTLTMLSSTNPAITTGQSVTLMATVTGTNPTGTVTFEDGTITLGSPVALAAGRASYSTSALAVGSHSISAVYSGDGQNAASTSQVVVETVAAPPATGGGTPSGNGGVSGGGGGGSFAWLDLCMLLLIGRLSTSARRGWTNESLERPSMQRRRLVPIQRSWPRSRINAMPRTDV